MATNLALDDELIRTARELGCHKTKKAAVQAALEEYIRQKRLELFFSLAGTIDFDEGWDPIEHRKEERRRATETARQLWRG